jgi:hypothetical protein
MSNVAYFDRYQLDDRNERPMAIALTTIVSVWAIAFALTIASANIRSQAPTQAYVPAAAASSLNR